MVVLTSLLALILPSCLALPVAHSAGRALPSLSLQFT